MLTTMRPVLVLVTAISAGLAIAGRMRGLMWMHWVFKPLTMLIIIGAVVSYAKPSPLRTWVLVALGFSLLGDVILMLPIKGFVFGLAAFMVALIVYAIAFTREGTVRPYHLAALPVLGVMLFFTLKPLWPSLGALQIPVAAYGAISCATIVAAAVRGNPMAIAGAALFTLSDTLLAYARFSEHHVPYPVELGCYFLAQLLLAMSLL